MRKTLVRAYWDGESSPSVDAPLGDFLGVGHGAARSYSCAVLNMSARPDLDGFTAMNCHFPMPFSEEGRIEIVNESDQALSGFWFYIDYDLLPRPPGEHGRFHAKWRRGNPTDGWVPVRPETQPEFGTEEAYNLTDKENYLFLEARGRGHFVGVNLSVRNLCRGWWGEGDDMLIIDGKEWPPDLHGTGSEDYFGHAFGMQPGNAFPYNGVSHHQPGTTYKYSERITVYRYHVNEPVIFHASLRASIEHGHASMHSNDYASTAYWYQTEPHYGFCQMLPVEQRLPRPDMVLGPAEPPGPKREQMAVRRRMMRVRASEKGQSRS